MIYPGALALALTAAVAITPASTPREDKLAFAQLIIREQIIVRVPVRRGPVAARPQKVDWDERGGPDCVSARDIAGASLANQSSVDLLLRDGDRLRARLESSCPALDYYYGFYIRPNQDGRICADRDAIHSRVGGSCEIDSFKRLKAKPQR